MRKCAGCRNTAPLNHHFCSACQRELEEEKFQQWLREQYHQSTNFSGD